MDQPIGESHVTDDEGNPAGGVTSGVGFHIEWQNGPLAIDGQIRAPNGAFVEGIISAAIGRMQFYQSTKFRCRENALAITHMQEAKNWLTARTADRVAKGIEGTHEQRDSEGQAG